MMSIDDDCRRLLALLTHEMRSPGAVVAGYLRMLKGPSTSDLPSREQKMIEEANRSCARMMHIVQELSDFRELVDNGKELQRVPLPIFTLCEEVVQKCCEEGSDVSLVVDDGDRETTMVDGHDVRLRQAIGALIASIVRERAAGAVEARGFVNRNGSAIALITFAEPGTIQSVSEVLRHRDLPFDQWRGGMGLALPIAQQIVDAHHGRLWAMPGSRATCALSLPLSM
jgi:signal transduction histidine kinase